MLDTFVEAGGTFVDTADVYGDGASEETLAPWLARRRDDVVLATKVRFEVSDPGGAGLAPERIRAACDASLRRLGVDVIDLYQVHAPDPDVDLGATLRGARRAGARGKVRALGASNFPAWLLAWAVAAQDAEGFAPFVSLQPQYSLVERSIEVEMLPFCRAAGLGVLPWGPLGAGFLTGRYRRAEPPPAGSRMADASDDLEEAPARRAIERNFRAVDEARAVADELGATVPQVALAWLLAQPGVTAPIIGPRTPEHLAGPAAGRRPAPVRRAGRASRPPYRAARELPPADARRAGRDRRVAATARPPLKRRVQGACLQEILQRAGFSFVGSTASCVSPLPSRRSGDCRCRSSPPSCWRRAGSERRRPSPFPPSSAATAARRSASSSARCACRSTASSAATRRAPCAACSAVTAWRSTASSAASPGGWCAAAPAPPRPAAAPAARARARCASCSAGSASPPTASSGRPPRGRCAASSAVAG